MNHLASAAELHPAGLAGSSVPRHDDATLHDALELANVGYWQFDFAAARVRWSESARRVYAVATDATPSLDILWSALPAPQDCIVRELLAGALTRRDPQLRYGFDIGIDGDLRRFDVRLRLSFADDGRLLNLLGTLQDVTALSDTRRQLHALSFFDPVTSLPNRALLIEKMQHASQDNGPGRFGVLMIELNRMRHVLDSVGRAAGDAYLLQAAKRLSSSLRETDTLARLEADRFAVLVPNLTHPDAVASVAGKLLNAMNEPFIVGETEVFATPSAGAAVFPDDGLAPDDLLLHADAALAHANSRGAGSFEFYAPRLTHETARRLKLESELRRAIERDELCLHYQPKFDLLSHRIVGAEALMRWEHPTRGLIAPIEFIPLAEETGLIVRMGRWALHTACSAIARWNTGAPHPLKVAVNLSARQFDGEQLVDSVLSALDATGCRPEWLELEITESLLLDGRNETRSTLEKLTERGITVAIDDFGMGYSALSYLARLPVQTLKVDRSFVKELPHDRSSVELTKVIVSLGKSLNMTLVAEGVETQAQADHLRAVGCDVAQGFLLGRPMPEPDFTALLQSQSAESRP